MTRGWLSFLGALVGGAACWMVFGFVAAQLATRSPGGAREGAGAMAGFFFVGPIFGVLGLILGGWVTWALLARPERAGAVGLGMAGIVVVLVAGVSFALGPTRYVQDDYPGRKAELQVEVSFPEAELARLGAGAPLSYEFRSADGTETAAAQRSAARHEEDRAIVPAAFRIQVRPRTKLLAVMQDERQLACATLTVEGPMEWSTEWSGWQELEAGLQARWRLVVGPK